MNTDEVSRARRPARPGPAGVAPAAGARALGLRSRGEQLRRKRGWPPPRPRARTAKSRNSEMGTGDSGLAAASAAE